MTQAVFVLHADHRMVISETGCVEERRNHAKAVWLNQSIVYLEALEEWMRFL